MRDPHPGWQQRVRDSLHRQRFITDTLAAELVDLEPGHVVLRMPFADAISQQHGYIHAGATASLADSACGYAAFSLAPPDHTVLTVEFKINLLAPARGSHLEADGRVLRAGRTLTTCTATVTAHDDGATTLVAALQATLMLFPGADQ